MEARTPAHPRFPPENQPSRNNLYVTSIGVTYNPTLTRRWHAVPGRVRVEPTNVPSTPLVVVVVVSCPSQVLRRKIVVTTQTRALAGLKETEAEGSRKFHRTKPHTVTTVRAYCRQAQHSKWMFQVQSVLKCHRSKASQSLRGVL